MSSCPAHQYKEGDRCCDKCPAGYFRSQHCSPSERTQCLPCRPGEYMDSVNYMSRCISCLKCEAGSNLEEVSQCSRTNNTQCRCKRGHYCHSHQEERCERCRKLTDCRPGEGVTKQATLLSDTSCGRCPPGTFNNDTNSWSPCQNHTVCALTGQIVLRPGSEDRDTSCAPRPADGSEWLWIVGNSCILFIVATLIIVICVRKRRRVWQGRTEKYNTQQMDQLLQLRMLKIVRETSEEVVESVVDFRVAPQCQSQGKSEDIKLLKGQSVDEVLLNGHAPSNYIEIVKGSSRSLPQTLLYENLPPLLHLPNHKIPRQTSAEAQTRGQVGSSAPEHLDDDGLETDCAPSSPKSRPLILAESQAWCCQGPGVGLRPGHGVGGSPRPKSESQAALAPRNTTSTDGGPKSLHSVAPSPALADLSPPTLTASEIFAQGRPCWDPRPPVALLVLPATPPARRRPGSAEVSGAESLLEVGALPKAGSCPGQLGVFPSGSNLQPEEDEWTE